MDCSLRLRWREERASQPGSREVQVSGAFVLWRQLSGTALVLASLAEEMEHPLKEQEVGTRIDVRASILMFSYKQMLKKWKHAMDSPCFSQYRKKEMRQAWWSYSS